MSLRLQAFLSIVALIIAAGVLYFIISHTPLPTPHPALSSSAAAEASATTTPVAITATTATNTATTTATQAKKVSVVKAVTLSKSTKQVLTSTSATTTPKADTTGQISRITNPYTIAPESVEQVNTDTRAALVNILCLSQGSLNPTSGSGVIIDPRGVILTNAHVAQYVLLAESGQVDLNCTIRTGSPAHEMWKARVLYMPPVWVAANAQNLNTSHPMGTGEHDYALLLITSSVDSTPLPTAFPSLPYDARQAIGFTGDQVLAAGYPAEFLDGVTAENNLFAASSPATIGNLLTFGSGNADAMSLGGIIEAQGGSSGGAVVNPWGRLIGIITTTSEGATTGERDLRATSLYYIATDFKAQVGVDLSTFLQGDLAAEEQRFASALASTLIQQYMARLKPAQ